MFIIFKIVADLFPKEAFTSTSTVSKGTLYCFAYPLSCTDQLFIFPLHLRGKKDNLGIIFETTP